MKNKQEAIAGTEVESKALLFWLLSLCFVFILYLSLGVKRNIEGSSSWGSVDITCFFRVSLKGMSSSAGNGFKGSRLLGKGIGWLLQVSAIIFVHPGFTYMEMRKRMSPKAWVIPNNYRHEKKQFSHTEIWFWLI